MATRSQPAANPEAAAAAAAAAAQQAAPAVPLLHLTVNGRSVQIPQGSSLYDAVSSIGAFVPVLCKHPRLPNTPGSCRWGAAGLMAAKTVVHSAYC
jgi:NADH-quinone oxidoreductase subunit G